MRFTLIALVAALAITSTARSDDVSTNEVARLRKLARTYVERDRPDDAERNLVEALTYASTDAQLLRELMELNRERPDALALWARVVADRTTDPKGRPAGSKSWPRPLSGALEPELALARTRAKVVERLVAQAKKMRAPKDAALAYYARGLFRTITAGVPGLRDALAADGGKTRMGIWIALNGYSQNIDWGVANGYLEAQRNEWFTRFKRYYSLTDPNYNADLREALAKIIADGDLSYFKHDFNEMCDVGEGRGHLPTDRHGHEANVDAMIDLLAFERECQSDIYQNMTNWIWFSPWWLMHNDCLWMMGSDAGSSQPQVFEIGRASHGDEEFIHGQFMGLALNLVVQDAFFAAAFHFFEAGRGDVAHAVALYGGLHNGSRVGVFSR